METYRELGILYDRDAGGVFRHGYTRTVGRPHHVPLCIVAGRSHGGPQPWGLGLTAFGVGTVLGRLRMTRWSPRRLLLVGMVGVLPPALPSAALAVPAPTPALVMVMFVTGVSVEVFSVAWMSALRQEMSEEKFPRVSSYDWLAGWLARVAGVGAGGDGAGRSGEGRGRPPGRVAEMLWC